MRKRPLRLVLDWSGDDLIGVTFILNCKTDCKTRKTYVKEEPDDLSDSPMKVEAWLG